MRTAWLFAKRGNPDRERRADPRLTGLSRDTLILRFLSPIAPLTGVAAPEGGWNSDCTRYRPNAVCPVAAASRLKPRTAASGGEPASIDRKSVVEGKSVDLGG